MPNYKGNGYTFFCNDIAMRYGINAAILLENIHYWIEHNRANGDNYIDGRTWTYDSIDAYSHHFPYMSPKQIRTALAKLKDEGILITGNHSTNKFDRRTWYSLTDYGESLFLVSVQADQKGNPDLPHVANENCTKGVSAFAPEGKSSIADIIHTDINTDTGGSLQPPTPATQSKKTKGAKEAYGEYQNVKLTPTERDRLMNEFGEAETTEAITFLDEYIEMKGYKAKSHYLAIRRWVFDAVKEQKAKKKGPQFSKATKDPTSADFDWDLLAQELEAATGRK